MLYDPVIVGSPGSLSVASGAVANVVFGAALLDGTASLLNWNDSCWDASHIWAMADVDAVNTVFRMETLSKTLDQPLIYSQDFQMRLASPSDSTDLGTHTVKGKSNAIRVFGLDGK